MAMISQRRQVPGERERGEIGEKRGESGEIGEKTRRENEVVIYFFEPYSNTS
jgi:hypothetical protein